MPMSSVHFSREDEYRLTDLLDKQRRGETLSDEETTQLVTLQETYQLFINASVQRLQEGAPSPNSSDQSNMFSGDALGKVGKAAYFWGSLVATAVPGFLGVRTGLVKDFEHWNWIVDHLLLGGLPVITKVGTSGNHLEQLKQQLESRGEWLACVVACMEPEELDGFGINVIQFAKEADWRSTINPDLDYILLAMEDGAANTTTGAMARTVERMDHWLKLGKAVYVHCKAGKGRSWMTVVCYLTTLAGMPYDVATDLVRQRRGQISPSADQKIFARNFPLSYAKMKSLNS